MKKRGISLIVLIITMVVIIILGTAIVVSIARSNIIENAKEAVLKQDLKVFEEELSLYAQNKYLETKGKFDITKLNATESSVIYTGEGTVEEINIYEILPSLRNSKYENIITIVDGKIVMNQPIQAGLYDENDELIVSWDKLVNEYGMDVSKDYTSSTYQTDTSSPYYIFTNNNLSGKLVIGDDVTRIGNYAFYNCISLISVEIPEGVTTIGIAAFRDCTNLNGVTILGQITDIANQTFHGCSNLISIKLPTTVKYIGEYAFNYCRKLVDINILSVTSINIYAFSSCSSFKDIKIPNCTYIAEGAFSYCDNLETIEIPSTLQSMGDKVFYYCENLKNVNIPQGIGRIPKEAFYYCRNLESVVIPESVTSIEKNAFYFCSSLSDLTVPDTVETIGTNAFYNVPQVYYNGSATGSPWGAKAIN